MVVKVLRIMYTEFRYSLLTAVFRKSMHKQTIIKDAQRWIKPYRLWERLPDNYTFYDLLFYIFNRYNEFRNLFYYRFIKDPAKNHFLFYLLRKICPPRDCVRLQTGEIGAGFFIQHGTCCSLGAKKIGKNCWINQQVTIGFSAEGKNPIVGNNVMIRPGAKIFGELTIGDNSIIGANAVVMKDVPPNCTVVGRPARIVRRNGQRVDEKL